MIIVAMQGEQQPVAPVSGVRKISTHAVLIAAVTTNAK
jgi:hypothetical protein